MFGIIIEFNDYFRVVTHL